MIRRTELRRTGSLRRTRIASTSKGRRASGQHRAETCAAVFSRDGHHCRLAGSTAGPCIGPLTPHHLRKASQGGPYTMQNLLSLCAGHNDWIETSPAADVVWLWGLVLRRGDPPEQAWSRLATHGIVSYWWDGSAIDGP